MKESMQYIYSIKISKILNYTTLGLKRIPQSYLLYEQQKNLGH